MQVTTKARVQLVLEIVAKSTWGPQCTMDQINKQAREDAVNQLTGKLFDGSPVNLVGTPKVTAITSFSDE